MTMTQFQKYIAQKTLWFLAALFVLFFNIIRAIEVFHHQSLRDLGQMLLASSSLILTCPLTMGALAS